MRTGAVLHGQADPGRRLTVPGTPHIGRFGAARRLPSETPVRCPSPRPAPPCRSAAWHPGRRAASAPETIVVHEHRVACDGGGGALGHPARSTWRWVERGSWSAATATGGSCLSGHATAKATCSTRRRTTRWIRRRPKARAALCGFLLSNGKCASWRLGKEALPPRELRLPLFDEGGHAFLLVLEGEQRVNSRARP